MNIQIIRAIEQVRAQEWDALVPDDNPFMRYEFLHALEANDCLGEKHGWLPRHFIVRDDKQQLIGAMPAYIKDNSYGEFVFDWSWADAYAKVGIDYYPKLVCAAPYTPATGPRLLIVDDKQREAIADLMIQAAIELARTEQLSSIHWLFPNQRDQELLQRHGLLQRMGVQYHWHNNNYADFDAFLATFSSKKRKNVKQERRKVRDAQIEIEVRHGDEMEPHHYELVEHYYRDTFIKKWGYPTLTRGFFEQVGRELPKQLVVFFALYEGRYVAAAICFRNDDTLYGRHWGCDAEFNSLHFELCYYQGIDYCIQQGLQHFEPGAQGEHKVARGFVPERTWSSHWVAHPEFRKLIQDFCHREHNHHELYRDALMDHLPYKDGGSE
jgi:predicted N-acyltransferase